MNNDFPLVALGCSAGGLQAIIEFVHQLPEKPGLSFVVVQHLSPNFPSQSKQMLDKKTLLKTIWVEDITPIEPDCLYVMPENKLMYMNQYNQLYLEPRPVEDKINRCIDIFFTSLASVKKEMSIGIIFSGAGKDGSEGVQAIHKAGGIVMVQSPFDAEYASMPMHAISADHPLAVSSSVKLAQELLEFVEAYQPEVSQTIR